jgi:nickel-dependent lactate racemase
MKIVVPYGRDHIEVAIPEANVLDIIKSETPARSEDESQIILAALKKPVASKRLPDLARGKRSAVILASDITRPSPSYKFLPFIVDELEAAGMRDITILFGLGIHRRQTPEERLKLAGEYAAGKVRRLIDSDEEERKFIGYTRAGTPVEVCEAALKSDLLIATGNLEYHYFVGYSGGAKAAVPGICSRNTIQANHSLMLDDRAVTGNYADNPVRQDIEEAGQMIGIDFLFNVILDDKKRILAAVSGNVREAYLEGIELYDGFFKRVIYQKADIVITSPGGYPKDMNLYQAQKALDNVKGIVKEDGEIVLVASCEEGFGEKTFEEWMIDARNYEKLNARIREKFVLGGHKAVAISKLIAKRRVLLYSCFGREKTESLGFVKVDNLQSYLDAKVERSPGVRIVVAPSGRFVQYN